MSKIFRIMIAASSLLACSAEAEIPMQVKESVQTFVWVLEALTVVTIIAVFWFVWRYSQRARERIKSSQKELSE